MSQEAAVSTERPEELVVISVDDHCGLLTQHGSAGAPTWTLASAPATQLWFQVLALSLVATHSRHPSGVPGRVLDLPPPLHGGADRVPPPTTNGPCRR